MNWTLTAAAAIDAAEAGLGEWLIADSLTCAAIVYGAPYERI